MSKIKVLIADDHAIVREGIRLILASHDDIEVVGEAADGNEAINQVNRLSPDVVLLDIAMPGLGGLEAAQEIIRTKPQCRILILTQYENTEYIYRFLKLGVAGYVVKKTAGTELVSAIRSVNQGNSFIDPAITSKVIEGFIVKSQTPDNQPSFELLSDREKQVLKLLAEGNTMQQIADILCLSIKTIMTHRTNLMNKIDVHNRTELVKYAIRQGLVGTDY